MNFLMTMKDTGFIALASTMMAPQQGHRKLQRKKLLAPSISWTDRQAVNTKCMSEESSRSIVKIVTLIKLRKTNSRMLQVLCKEIGNFHNYYVIRCAMPKSGVTLWAKSLHSCLNSEQKS